MKCFTKYESILQIKKKKHISRCQKHQLSFGSLKAMACTRISHHAPFKSLMVVKHVGESHVS